MCTVIRKIDPRETEKPEKNELLLLFHESWPPK